MQRAVGHPLAPVSEAEVGNGRPESLVPGLGKLPATWQGDPVGKPTWPILGHSDSQPSAAHGFSSALHHSRS